MSVKEDELGAEVAVPTEEVAEEGANAILAAIKNLFDQLDPDIKIVQLKDVNGNTYEASENLNARKQMRLLRSVNETIGANKIEFTGDMDMVAGIIDLALNEAMFNVFIEAFEAGYAGVITEARKKALELKENQELVASGEVLGAAELFRMEEIAVGLVPFFVAPILRLVEALKGLAKMPPEKPPSLSPQTS